jgi:hypothetical protein
LFFLWVARWKRLQVHARATEAAGVGIGEEFDVLEGGRMAEGMDLKVGEITSYSVASKRFLRGSLS